MQLERNELNISPFSVGLTNNLSVCPFVFAFFAFWFGAIGSYDPEPENFVLSPLFVLNHYPCKLVKL